MQIAVLGETHRNLVSYDCQEPEAALSQQEPREIPVRSSIQKKALSNIPENVIERPAISANNKFIEDEDMPFNSTISLSAELESDSPQCIIRYHPMYAIPESLHRPKHILDSCEVMVSYLENPCEFYVHIACKETTLIDVFQECLNTFYTKEKVPMKTKDIEMNRMGEVCVCYHEVQKWSRAQILDWCLGKPYVRVQLIDYGDICSISFDLIQPISKRFLKQNVYATRCHLAYVKPPASRKTWPAESSKVFSTCIRQKPTVRVDGVDLVPVYNMIKAGEYKYCVPLGKYQVIHQISMPVILQDVKCLEAINDALVELGYASLPEDAKKVALSMQSNNEDSMPKLVKSNFANITEVAKKVLLSMESKHDDSMPKLDKLNLEISDRKDDVAKWVMNTKGLYTRPHVVAPQNNFEETSIDGKWNPMRDDFIDHSENRQSATLAVSGYDAQDEKRVCRFYAQSGRCYKGNNCTMEHSFTRKDGYTTDQELVYTCAFVPLAMPIEGSEIQITVTHIPKHKPFFYCTIPGDSVVDPNEETLTTLQNHMNKPKVINKCPPLHIPAALGQVILAFSTHDSLWHRAQVVQELDDSNDTLEVLFVDNGKTEMIHEDESRTIENSMLHLPFQAIECHLSNVEIDPKLDAVELLQAFCLGKTLNAKVSISLDRLQIMHCLLSDENGHDLGDTLIKAGLAVNKDYVYIC